MVEIRVYIALPRAPQLESPRIIQIALHVDANSRLAIRLPHQPSFGSPQTCSVAAVARSYWRWLCQEQDRTKVVSRWNLQ
jgi:hypothetical protein